MSYTAFNTTEISSGKPNKQDLWQKVKDDFDNHETRILALEGTGLTTDPIQFSVFGSHHTFGALTAVSYVRIAYDLTLTGARLYVPAIGTSGALTVDVQKSAAGGGSFSSIFSTKPSVAVAAGNHGVSTNAILSTTDLVAGDILRLDTTVVQIACEEFHLYLTHIVAA